MPRGIPKTHFTSETATAAVTKRWDAVTASEGEIRSRFRELSIPEALEELAKIRKVSEIAATEINQRMNNAGEECHICQTKFDGRTKRPMLTEPFRDPDTGVMVNRFYCSIVCVQRRNKEKLGLEAMIK